MTDAALDALVALRDDGLILDAVQWNAGVQRCGTADRPKSKNGWYSAHDDGFLVVNYGDWRTGECKTWHAKGDKPLLTGERKRLAGLREQAKRERLAEQEKQWASAAMRAQRIYAGAADCAGHAYLAMKGVKPCARLKVCGPSLVVPVYDEASEIVSLQFIGATGEKRFLTGGKTGGCFFRIGEKPADASPLLLCEGLATGLSLHQATTYPVWCAFNAGNLLPVAEFVRRKFPDRKIVVCADNDIGTGGNPGLTKATAAALAADAFLAVSSLKSGGKCDFNDLHKSGGHDEVFRQFSLAEKPEPPKETLPAGFSLREGKRPGLWHSTINDKDEPVETWLGAPLRILGETRDAASEAWGLLLQWCDPDGKEHTWAMPRDLLDRQDASCWRGQLSSGGWRGNSSQKARGLLRQFLDEYETKNRVRCVDRTGWHDGVYVFPGINIRKRVGQVGQVGQTSRGNDPTASDSANSMSGMSDAIVLQVAAPLNPFKVAGDFATWRDSIGAYARGNSRLALALCASLAAVLLEPSGQESGGFNFVGASTTGKTTALVAAASIWGKGAVAGGYVQSWRATSNGLEGLAALHSDAALCLDELSQISAAGLSEASYMLANGAGKARSRQDGTAREAKSWRVMFLSSGEVGLAEKLAEDGYRANAGQEVRLVDLPADAGTGLGLFEELRGHGSAGAFADAIRDAAARHYGHAARVFIQAFADNRAEAMKTLTLILRDGLAALCDCGADGQVKRVAGRFLLCAAAGEMAVEWGILPWAKGDALAAVKKCFDAWIENRGGTGAAEDRNIIEQVTLFLEQHGQGRFQDVSAPDAILRDRVGFRQMEGSTTMYYVLPESFRREVCKGHNATRAARVLAECGILLRGDGRNLTRYPILPGLGRQRCYALILRGDDSAE